MKDYGGAYDILPDQYWTKDDITALINEAEDFLPESVQVESYYMSDDEKELQVEINYRGYGGEIDLKIDKRVAGTEQELVANYTTPLVRAILAFAKEQIIGELIEYCMQDKYPDVQYSVEKQIRSLSEEELANNCKEANLPTDWLGKEQEKEEPTIE